MPCFVSQRLVVLNNYNYKCSICGKPTREVHHKDVDRKNNDLDNLTPLCRTCHSATHTRLRQKVTFAKEVLRFDVFPEEKKRLEDVCKKLGITKIEFLRQSIEKAEKEQ